MAVVRRIVVDVLKPHSPPLVEFTERISETEGIESTHARLIEFDREVQNIEVVVEGADVDYDALEETVEGIGASIHSIDEVVCGDLPSTRRGATPADRGTPARE